METKEQTTNMNGNLSERAHINGRQWNGIDDNDSPRFSFT